MEIFDRTQSVSEMYAKWNGLAAYNNGTLIELIKAHDGDFMPESPFDYIEEIRSALENDEFTNNYLFPKRVDIDITQNCTDNCYFCYSKKYALNPLYSNAFISADAFSNLVEELALKGTKSIRFTGGGEPLIHQDIEKLITIVNANNLKSTLITNGSLLRKQIHKTLINNLSHLRVSLNAVKNETRQKIHFGSDKLNNIDAIFKNLEELILLRKKNIKGKNPLITVTCLILPENINELELLTQKAKKIGVDSISFRPIYHELSNKYSKQQKETLASKLKKIKNMEDPPFFSVFIPQREIFKVWNNSPKDFFDKCISCYLRTVIESTNNGNLIKICGLFRGKEDGTIGFIEKNKKFSDIWNAETTKTKLSTFPATCNKCIDISMNLTLNAIYRILKKYPKAEFFKCNINKS